MLINSVRLVTSANAEVSFQLVSEALKEALTTETFLLFAPLLLLFEQPAHHRQAMAGLSPAK